VTATASSTGRMQARLRLGTELTSLAPRCPGPRPHPSKRVLTGNHLVWQMLAFSVVRFPSLPKAVAGFFFDGTHSHQANARAVATNCQSRHRVRDTPDACAMDITLLESDEKDPATADH